MSGSVRKRCGGSGSVSMAARAGGGSITIREPVEHGAVRPVDRRPGTPGMLAMGVLGVLVHDDDIVVTKRSRGWDIDSGPRTLYVPFTVAADEETALRICRTRGALWKKLASMDEYRAISEYWSNFAAPDWPN